MKCNNAPADLPAVRFEMTAAIIPSAAGDVETAFPVFDSEPVQFDLAKAMSGGREKPGPQPNKTKEVAEWLLSYLRDAGHPVLLAELYDQAGAGVRRGIQARKGWQVQVEQWCGSVSGQEHGHSNGAAV